MNCGGTAFDVFVPVESRQVGAKQQNTWQSKLAYGNRRKMGAFNALSFARA